MIGRRPDLRRPHGFLRKWTRDALWLLSITVFVLFIGEAGAQTTSASLKGVVRSPSGEPVADATIQARSEATGIARTTHSDASGRFRFELLAPGEWTVIARPIDGAASAARTVVLQLQKTAAIDLTVGTAITETVTVKAEAPRVDSQRVGNELRVDGHEVNALPISGRTVTDLALLDSAVQATPPGGFYGERGSVFVVNGQSGRANSFLVDGLDNNDQVSGTTLNAYFSQQVIREFVVLTHQFAPEFGRATGGVMNIVTERGENEAAGEVFLQGASPGWNQPGAFVSSLPGRDGLRDTSGSAQSGFRLGGPLKKDRAFYFLAFEHQRSDTVTPYTGRTRDGVLGGWTVAPSRDDNFFLKTDFNLGSSHFLMVRLSGDDRASRGINVAGNTTPEAGFELKERDVQLAASLTSVASSNLLNEVRLLTGTSAFNQRANSDRPGAERPSGTFGGNSLNRQARDEVRFQLVDNITWRVGRQTLKFGADVTHSKTKVRIRFNPNGNFIYDTDQPFEPGDCGNLLFSQIPRANPDGTHDPIWCPGKEGVDDDGDGTIDEPGLIDTYPVAFTLIDGSPEASLVDNRLALFAQSSWQVSPKFVLDYGLRYDLSTFRLPKKTRVESSIPNGGAGRDYDNIAPRLGFTWTPRDDGKFLVRGGAGVFYDKLVLGFPALAAITSGTKINFLFPQALTYEVTEQYVEEVGIDNLRPELFFFPELTLRFSTGTRLDTPYTVQYTLGGEHAIGSHGVFRADVVRGLGYHQALMKDLNPPLGTFDYEHDGTLDLGIPVHYDGTVGSIAAIVTEGRSWYTGLDLGWRWKGETFGYAISYTWSKALDEGPDPLKGGIAIPPGPEFLPLDPDVPLKRRSDDIRAEKARSDADRRHRIVLSGESGIPGLGLRLTGVVQASTGVPFNVTSGQDDNLDGLYQDRPNGVGRNTGAQTPLGPVNRLRRIAHLAPVQSLREPKYFQVDLRVSKPFTFKKDGNAHGELFVQVFNVLDRFNGGPVEGRITSRNFGKPIGQVGPSRTLDFGLKAGF